MMFEKIAIGSIIAFVLVFLGTVVYKTVDSALYKEVESEIIVKKHYDGVEGKKAAVDECMKILETNDYTMCKAGIESHGSKTFAVVKGEKYKAKESR